MTDSRQSPKIMIQGENHGNYGDHEFVINIHPYWCLTTWTQAFVDDSTWKSRQVQCALCTRERLAIIQKYISMRLGTHVLIVTAMSAIDVQINRDSFKYTLFHYCFCREEKERSWPSRNIVSTCFSWSPEYRVRVVLIYLSHTRESFKGDEASQWKRPKFDPTPRRNPLTDLHQN